ncbi:MAG: glycosyltransferase [Butyrivibrio sp.]|nr:glycosyltransferase [Ruminococcus flavefaciens]MCM1561202.1 glycosyltransferase [Butyrivibrio sp.]
MNVYITKLNGMPYRSTEQYKQQMTANIAHALGIREMGIYRYYAENESAENRQRRFDGIIAGMQGGDVVICQFPTWNGLAFERALVRHIKAYHGRIVIFIHDLEALMFENRRSALQGTVGLYNEAEVLIVPSQKMKRFLIEQGIRSGMKFIVQEMWDYTTQLKSLQTGRLKRELHFIGDPDKYQFLHEWNYETPLNVYSDQECRGDNLRRKGWMEPERLLLELSEGGFGLVWYGDENGLQYSTMSNSPELSACLAAGIPVIVPRGISNQCMIEENHLGVVVDTLEEAVKTVQSITEQEYREYTSAVAQFASLLREGYFTKKCLTDTVQMMLRRDMYTYSETNNAYEMPDCMFEYVCLHEAYENKLALSWVFRGEAEGFLIYNADSGKLVEEVSNGLEHYLLLKNYPKETRFVVKAYVRAVKGKMILAESGVAAVSKRESVQSRVSLIMPAYNAEEFVARSIDTALAQTFADLEIIVVNDGSTDRTQEVIDWYRERYPQVKSLYQSNAGQAVARNNGVGHAGGDYIGYMDSDDMLRPDMMEKLYDSIQKNSCDIAMTSAWQMTNEGYEEVGVYPLEENKAIPMDEFFEHYIRYAYPVIWNKLYRKSLVQAHPIPAVKYEDSAWIPCILSYAENICYINEHLYEYDRIIRNVTYIHTSWGKSEEEQFADRRDYVKFFLENGNPQKRNLLKRLALGYAVGFVSAFTFPKFKELRQEIEQMWGE